MEIKILYKNSRNAMAAKRKTERKGINSGGISHVESDETKTPQDYTQKKEDWKKNYRVGKSSSLLTISED